MKKLLGGILMLSAAFVIAQTADEIAEFREKITANKSEAQSSLTPYKYDGSKITYYNVKTFEQVKEVEVYLFNNTDYKFSFSAKSANHDVVVKIYDKDRESEDRVLLKEISNVKGTSFLLNSKELNDTFKSKGGSDRLKRVYVDYVIPKSTGKVDKTSMDSRGAVVLVMGYK
ncbi:MAG: hypothetical protein KDC84_08645 [Crocinitomicaceae bacterium]|nr:hypothetical protein [Crocinitomicaceae bacterium]